MTHTLRARAILFDLDGVLINSEQAVVASWREWALAHDLDPDELLPQVHGRRSRDTIAHITPHLDTEVEAQHLLQLEIDHVASCTGYAGAKALIDALAGHPHAVVTSGEWPLASARLGQGGITPPNVFVTAHDVTHGKPDPEGYLLAASKLGIAPEHCIVVEDAPAGIQAAKTGGMRAIGVATSVDPSELTAADMVVPDIGALALHFEGEWIVISTQTNRFRLII
ncbi:MAG: HAD-IA family hydrolase [Anaerolineae bacterium]|nr:HAD-IA family hydrolase [Anaerolineae bacterium]